MANFRLFQIERVKDNNSKFEKNGRKFSKCVENTMGKGEIACYEQFLLFIRPSKTGRIMGSPVAGGRAGGRRPVLCPEHISKTTLARVMKFHGWIDLIQGSAVRRNHNSCSLNF